MPFDRARPSSASTAVKSARQLSENSSENSSEGVGPKKSSFRNAILRQRNPLSPVSGVDSDGPLPVSSGRFFSRVFPCMFLWPFISLSISLPLSPSRQLGLSALVSEPGLTGFTQFSPGSTTVAPPASRASGFPSGCAIRADESRCNSHRQTSAGGPGKQEQQHSCSLCKSSSFRLGQQRRVCTADVDRLSHADRQGTTLFPRGNSPFSSSPVTSRSVSVTSNPGFTTRWPASGWPPTLKAILGHFPSGFRREFAGRFRSVVQPPSGRLHTSHHPHHWEPAG